MWIINLGKCVFVCNRVHPTTLLSQSLRVWLFDRGTSETQTPHEWFMRGRRDRGIREERKHYRTTHTKQHETHKLYVINTVYHFSNASMEMGCCMHKTNGPEECETCMPEYNSTHAVQTQGFWHAFIDDRFIQMFWTSITFKPMSKEFTRCSWSHHPSIHPSLCADDHCLWYYSHYQKVETEVSH